MNQPEEHMPFDRKPDPFGLPQGYFQSSASQLLHKMQWLEEQREFPALSSLGNKSPFSVPAAYFVKAEQALELLDYPTLLSLKKENGFAIPEAYFEELEANELAKVMQDKEPVLNLPPRQQPFKIKDPYFRENEVRLQQLLLKENKPAKVIRLFGSQTRLAVAALLVVALGFWLYTPNTAPVKAEDCNTIACLDRMDLLKSKNLESLETDELYDLVNSKDLEKKLEGSTAAQPDKKADSLDDETLDELRDDI